MTPTHAVKTGRRYRYYVSTQLITCLRTNHAKGWRIPAGDVEALVLNRLRAFFASQQDVGEALSCFDLDASTLRSALSKAIQLSESWTTLPSIRFESLYDLLSSALGSTMKKSTCRSSLRNLHLICWATTPDCHRMDNPISSSCASKPSCAGRVKE